MASAAPPSGSSGVSTGSSRLSKLKSIFSSDAGRVLTGLAVGGLAVGVAATLIRKAYNTWTSDEAHRKVIEDSLNATEHHSIDVAQALIDSSDLLVRFESTPEPEDTRTPLAAQEDIDQVEEDPESTTKAVEWVADVGLQRMLMVHNMKLHGSVKLEASQPTGDPVARQLEEAVQTQMKRAHWDLMQEQLREGNTTRLIAEIGSIKALLLELDPSTKHHTLLEENLDTALIEQMVSHEAFSAEQFSCLLTFLHNEIKAYDCPGNDNSNVESFAKFQAHLSQEGNEMSSVLPQVISFLIDKLQQIKVDKANILLEWLRPVVEHHGVEIEREYMNEAITKGELALDNTSGWIRGHAQPSDSSDDANKVHLALRRGVMELISSEIPATQRLDFPESLMLDRTTIQMLQNALQLIVLTAAGLIEDCNQARGSRHIARRHDADPRQRLPP